MDYHLEYMKNSSNQFRKTKNSTEKWAKHLNRHFMEGELCLNVLVLREMQIKPPLVTISHTLTGKKPDRIRCWRESRTNAMSISSWWDQQGAHLSDPSENNLSSYDPGVDTHS